MSRAEILVRLQTSDSTAFKTIGLSPDGLITIESWKVKVGKPKADLKRRTIGPDTYAPALPADALCNTILAERDGFELQTIIDDRDGTEWVNASIALDSAAYEAATKLLTESPSIDDDVALVQVGDAVIALPTKQEGVVWLNRCRVHASFLAGTDHAAMTLLGAITMKAVAGATVTSAKGTAVDLRAKIKPSMLSDGLQDFGAAAKLFVIPMKFSKAVSAVW